MRDHDVCDVSWGDAEPVERIENDGPIRDHPRIDDDHPITVTDEADRPGHPTGDIPVEQNVELGHGRQTREPST